jgi:hypothetical protein
VTPVPGSSGSSGRKAISSFIRSLTIAQRGQTIAEGVQSSTTLQVEQPCFRLYQWLVTTAPVLGPLNVGISLGIVIPDHYTK